MKETDTDKTLRARGTACDVSHSVPALSKDEWLCTYTQQILHVWRGRQTPLGLAPTYARYIRKDLAVFYEQPLMRAFIEQTY